MLKVKPAQALKGVGLKKPASFLMYLPAGCLLVGVVALSPPAGPRVPATLGCLTNHQLVADSDKHRTEVTKVGGNSVHPRYAVTRRGKLPSNHVVSWVPTGSCPESNRSSPG